MTVPAGTVLAVVFDPLDPPGGVTLEQVEQLLAERASVEDLFTSLVVAPNLVQVTTAESWPLLVAPFPLTVTSVTLTVWGGSGVPGSNTSFWQLVVRALGLDAVTQRQLVQKTTRLTDGALPAGEPITARRPWAFGLPPVGDLEAGEVLNLAAFPTGGPVPLVGALGVTVGYRPR